MGPEEGDRIQVGQEEGDRSLEDQEEGNRSLGDQEEGDRSQEVQKSGIQLVVGGKVLSLHSDSVAEDQIFFWPLQQRYYLICI